jgi:hypothetical protein
VFRSQLRLWPLVVVSISSTPLVEWRIRSRRTHRCTFVFSSAFHLQQLLDGCSRPLWLFTATDALVFPWKRLGGSSTTSSDDELPIIRSSGMEFFGFATSTSTDATHGPSSGYMLLSSLCAPHATSSLLLNVSVTVQISSSLRTLM